MKTPDELLMNAEGVTFGGYEHHVILHLKEVV
jgi:hypothetical protein